MCLKVVHKTAYPLYAVAIIIKLNDSLLVGFTRTDDKGFFKIEKLPVDTYQVIVSHPRFGEQSFIILGNKNDTIVDFKKIILPPKSVTIQEVTIYGFADAVYYKGDTLVYTADSFKVKQNAVVEDLLKKLPGIKVDAQGKIYSQGTAVDQVLVDGDEFFGADPTIATKNLNASALESVQVYDKKNENATDNTDKETLKVMNLQLKEDAKKGYFGKVSGASDFNKFYEGDILVNKFKGSQKISVFALTSNTPRSQFDWNDMWKYGLNNEMNTHSSDDGMTYYYNTNSRQKGIPKTFKSGFYFTNKIGKKLKISSNYSYTTANVDAETGTTSQYFLEDTTYSTDKLNTSFQRSEAHNMSLTVNYNIDSLTELEVQPRYKYNTGFRRSFEINKFLTSENILSRISLIENSNSNDANDFSNGIKVTRNFKKRDRKISANYNFSMQDSESDGKLISDNEYYLTPQTDADINQLKKNTNEKQSHRVSLSYTEPLSKKLKLEF